MPRIDKLLKYILKWISDAGKTVSSFAYTSMVTAGAISPGNVVPSGTDIDEFLKQLLLTVLNPVIQNPSLSVSINIGYSDRECGEILSFSISLSFSRGQILGVMDNGVWNTNLFQNYRSGVVLSYVIHGSNVGLSTHIILSDYQFVLGSNVFSSSANHDIGPQPLNSSGLPFSSPLSAGSVSNLRTIIGKRNTFFGCSFTGFSNLSPVYNCITVTPVPHIAIPESYGDVTSDFPVGSLIKVIQSNGQYVTTNVAASVYSMIYGYDGFWTLIIPTSHNYADAVSVSRVEPYYFPVTSDDIRSLSGSALGLVNGSQFYITILSGSTIVLFAYPASLRDVTSVFYELFNAELVGLFGTPTIISVAGANNYSPTDYKLYHLIPDAPFSETVQYRVTI